MIIKNEAYEAETLEKVEEIEEMEELVIAPKKKRGRKTKEQKEEVVETNESSDNWESKLPAWKLEYKRVFKNEIDGETIIWRRLKRGEYKNILNQEEENADGVLSKQELMVAAAVLYPYDIENIIEDNAGLATVLSEEILAKSGFAMSYTEEL